MPLVDLVKLSPPSFPAIEDDGYEFKSSQIDAQKLKRELDRAASAFANAGGGCFIAGVDDTTGDPDGGLERQIGRQSLRDWIDQIVHLVVPTPSYEIRVYDDCEGRGSLDAGKVIAAISIHPSEIGPHMASDHKYYVRAGAHTVPASHFLVEALLARRQVRKPMLTHVVRKNPNSYAIELGIIALTDAPAVNATLNLDPLWGHLESMSDSFPIRIPVIDKNNSYFLTVGWTTLESEDQIPNSVDLTIEYHDLSGNSYTHTNSTPLNDLLGPAAGGDDILQRIARAVEEIARGDRIR